MLELNRIYNMDCLEGMNQLRDKCVDLVPTDPPYGINTGKMGYIKNPGGVAKSIDYGEYDWDESPLNTEQFNEIIRVSKNQVIWGGNHFSDIIPQSNCWLIWNKINGMSSSDFADCEIAWTSFDSPIRIFNYLWCGMIKKKKEKRYHPTQKPLRLMEWVIKNYSNEGDLILDPFMGSGTTAVACRRLNRNFIGFEISKEYCEIANERLNNIPQRLETFGG